MPHHQHRTKQLHAYFISLWGLLTNTLIDLISKHTEEEEKEKKKKKKMGYVLRVRLASFFCGAATASFAGLYFLHKDYKVAHEAISHQVKGLYESLDGRISALEKLKEVEVQQPVEASE